MTTSPLDEAYERFRGTGPEWGGNLSNHGAMAVEVLARRGFPQAIDPWIAAYLPRLDQLPRPRQAITEASWAQALGDFGRVGDWTDYFRRQLEEQPWREVLTTWWPRLFPGIPAALPPGRTLDAARALAAVPRIADQSGPLARRFGRLTDLVVCLQNN